MKIATMTEVGRISPAITASGKRSSSRRIESGSKGMSSPPQRSPPVVVVSPVVVSLVVPTVAVGSTVVSPVEEVADDAVEVDSLIVVAPDVVELSLGSIPVVPVVAVPVSVSVSVSGPVVSDPPIESSPQPTRSAAPPRLSRRKSRRGRSFAWVVEAMDISVGENAFARERAATAMVAELEALCSPFGRSVGPARWGARDLAGADQPEAS